MNRKPKSKLPAGWDVYTSANRKPPKSPRPPKRPRRGAWKYLPWALLIGVLAAIAFYPWPI